MVAAFSIDLTEVLPGKTQPTKASSILTLQKSMTLLPCESTKGGYLGPLVPDQNTLGTESNLLESQPEDKVPKSEWSFRAGFSISTPTDPEYWGRSAGIRLVFRLEHSSTDCI